MKHLMASACFFLAAAAALPIPAGAVTISDPAGDFLPTYTGAVGGDLDVVSIDVRRTFANIILGATMAGPLGTTPGAIFVWGIDRGQGTARFVAGTPSVGAGVLFDSVVVLRPDGTGNFIDLLNAANNFALPTGAVVVDGADLTATVAVNRVPSTGFAVANFGYNLWPRLGSVPGNAGISDFAPDASVITASFVPEPATWTLLLAGFAGAGVMARRRRAVAAGG